MNRTITIFLGALIIIGFCVAYTSYQIINVTQQSNEPGEEGPTNSQTPNQTSGAPATNDTYKPPEKKDVELDVSIAKTQINLHGKKAELYGN
jgi:cytoskeletal protein RodZ